MSDPASGGAGDVYVGMDLGGTATRFVTIDDESNLLTSTIVSTPSVDSRVDIPTFFRDAIVDAVGPGRLAAVGIGASGPIDESGVIRNPDTLPGFTGVDIPAMIDELFHVSCHIENDAVTAALGEAVAGAGRGFRNILMVTLGTGIGVSMLQNGVPVRASDGQHPELGHISIGGPAAPCYCGRETCWEQAASRLALQRASTALATEPTGSSDDIRAVADRATLGDPAAMHLFDDFGIRLADGIATLLTAYRPEILIIGGSASAFFAHYRESLQAALGNIMGTFPSPIISAAEFGEYGGAIGAAALAKAKATVEHSR
jgi:glucokinase